MGDVMITLICPPGASDGTIAHGDTQYHAYRANHLDPRSRWLVDLPDHIASHFVVSGLGFWPLDPEVARRFGRR